MNVNTKITIAAQCDKAARDGTNEDNCLVVLSVGRANKVSLFGKDTNSIDPAVSYYGDVTAFSAKLTLQDKGCLLVVADGMGGMNAGEVASKIAVTTLAECFSEKGTKNLELTDSAIQKFIRKSIVAADAAIKKEAAKDREKEGMGTTVALLWLLPNNTAYYAWCGDSRIYHYRPENGLQTLSRDHSFVMENLKMSEEAAFDDPNNNIITRSLGNPSEKANPDIEGPINIYQDDLFLLCSDGLCGALPSRKIHAEISCIEDVIEEHIPDADHLVEGINELWTAAAAAGWHDNVTTLLCQVSTGPKRPEPKKKSKVQQTNKSNTSAPPIVSSPPCKKEGEKKRSRKDTLIAFLAVILVFGGVFAGFFMSNNGKSKQSSDTHLKDTTKMSSPVGFQNNNAGKDTVKLRAKSSNNGNVTDRNIPVSDNRKQSTEVTTVPDDKVSENPSLNFRRKPNKDNHSAQEEKTSNSAQVLDLKNEAKKRQSASNTSNDTLKK